MAQSSSFNFSPGASPVMARLQSGSCSSPIPGRISRDTSQSNIGITRTVSANGSVGSWSPRCSLREPPRDRGSSEIDHVPGNWQKDTNACGLCGITIGKLSRHHCRICGLCVCASCSPSGFQVDGSHKVQRACKACVTNAVRVPAVMQRLSQFSSKLFALSNERDPSLNDPPPTHNLLEAASRCEAALSPLEVMLVESKRRAERAEADLGIAGELAHQLQERLHELTAGSAEYDTPVKFRPSRRHRIAQSWSAGINSTGYDTNEAGKSSSAGGDSPDLPRQPKTVLGKEWQDNTLNCSDCGAKFGWRRFKRWHHCRICGRCICSKCSTSKICLQKGEKPVRVCTRCAADAPRLCAFANRARDLSVRVGTFLGQEASEHGLQSEDLRDLLRHCESALEPLEEMNEKIGAEMNVTIGHTASECASSRSENSC